MSSSESPLYETPLAEPAPEKKFAPSAVFNLDAEQSLLGALLVQNDVLDDVADFLHAAHFYDPLHQRIYTAIQRLVGQGNLASVVTLKTALAQDEGLAQLGGDDYLASLYANASALSHAGQFAKLIYDLALRRSLIALGQQIATDASQMEADKTPQEQIEAAERALYGLAEAGGTAQGFLSFADNVTHARNLIDRAKQRDTHLSGLSTGFYELDRILGGLQNSDLLIIAARPAMGKTSLATNIAFHIARQAARANAKPDDTHTDPGGVVGFFSLEMAGEQLAARILAQDVGVPASKLRKGDLTDADFSRLLESAKRLENLPLFIDETGAISLASLTARARRLKRQHRLGVLVVDYLQLVRNQRRNDNRVQEISDITQGLKALAKELNIPVIALSQLSRQVELRDNKRPQLSDLRESGAIEQDADVVMFIYREAYYLQHQEPDAGSPDHIKWQEKSEKCAGKAEIIIGKNRHGPAPSFELQFNDKLTKFNNLDTTHNAPDLPPPPMPNETAPNETVDEILPDTNE